MKKYKLAKDLPFAKAGESVIVGENTINVDLKKDGLPFIGDAKNLAMLISEGWIEEVKPREMEIRIGATSVGVYDLTNQRSIIQPNPVEPMKECIRVQEIL